MCSYSNKRQQSRSGREGREAVDYLIMSLRYVTNVVPRGFVTGSLIDEVTVETRLHGS